MTVLLLAAVVIGRAFGSASATVESLDGEVMVVFIEVEVGVATETVVAHLSFEDDPVLTLPLIDRGDGSFGLRTELEPKNYFVVFEVVDVESQPSDPVSLAQMGADLGPDPASPTTTLGEDELSPESRQLLWLAVALAAGSLSLLAFWVLGSRDEGKTGDADAPGQDEEE
jgi:hypothetical protein